jgi:nucleotide-binding universal stress UspA family protein
MAGRRSPTADQDRRCRIVVGVDPCPVSRAAMRWATSLAGWLDAEVVVVHALGPAPTRAEVPAASIAAQVAASLYHDWCTPFREAAISYRLLVREGTPVEVLHHAVEVEDPDLLVVGRHSGAPEWGRLSTSLGVLAEPQVPTLVVPEAAPEPRKPAPAGEPGGLTWRALVGIDGSAPSLRALDLAVDLTEVVGGDIVAVAAVEDVPVFPLGPATTVTSEGETDAPARAAAMLTAACAPPRARGLHVRTICQRGAPAAVLSRLATMLDVDLVAVGTRGVGAPDHPMLGSVSRRLVCDGPRPILVAPATPAPRPPNVDPSRSENVVRHRSDRGGKSKRDCPKRVCAPPRR